MSDTDSHTPADTGQIPIIAPRAASSGQKPPIPDGYVLVPRAKLIRRIGPRSLIGIVVTVAAFATGMGVAGGVLYAYYDNQLSSFEQHLAAPYNQANQQFKAEATKVNQQVNGVVGQIKQLTAPLRSAAADPKALTDLPTSVGKSIWQVHTSGTAGQTVAGSAFVVSSDSTGSYLLTSYSLVQAATVSPGPTVNVSQGTGGSTPAQLYNWSKSADLALLHINTPNLPVVSWVPQATANTAIGLRVYAMGAYGARNAAADPGNVIDASTDGYQISMPLGTGYIGGPVVLSNGQVLAVGVTNYQPMGITGGAVPFVPGLQTACGTVLSCSSKTISAGVANGG